MSNFWCPICGKEIKVEHICERWELPVVRVGSILRFGEDDYARVVEMEVIGHTLRWEGLK